MTKIERFNEMLNKYEFTADEVAFIENEIALITKRNARKSTKPTKAQIANIAVKESLATALGEATPDRKGGWRTGRHLSAESLCSAQADD